MTDEKLEHLLHLADSASSLESANGSRLIVAAEKRLIQQRRQRKWAGAAVAVLLLVSMDVLVLHRRPIATVIAEQNNSEALAAEIQVDSRVVKLLEADQRRLDAQAKLAELENAPGSEAWLQNQREMTADLLLRSAATTPDKRDGQIVYREVVALFPDAAAATVADARLAE